MHLPTILPILNLVSAQHPVGLYKARNEDTNQSNYLNNIEYFLHRINKPADIGEFTFIESFPEKLNLEISTLKDFETESAKLEK